MLDVSDFVLDRVISFAFALPCLLKNRRASFLCILSIEKGILIPLE